MRNLMLIVSMLFLLSCGSETTKNKVDSKADVEKAKTEEVKTEKAEEAPKNECEQFLVEYEAWVVELESARKELNADPSNEKLKQLLLRAGQKNTNWVNRWDSLADCEDNETYEDKMLDIEDRFNKCTML